MSRLLLVRHGQASAGSDDYDRLSDLGWRQARILGEHWASHGIELDRVVVGTLRRQIETAEAVRESFVKAGGVWPETESEPAFNEHSGYAVVLTALEELRDHDPKIGAWVESLEREPDVKTFLAAYRYITRLWVKDELDSESNNHEPWAEFRSRVREGVESLAAELDRGQTAAVFTSGGPVGVTAAWVLGLDDTQALEMTWTVHNAAVTELTARRGGRRTGSPLGLRSFNGAAYLPTADLVTSV